MKRLLWLGIGLAVGVVAYRRVARTAQRFTPGGIATSMSQSAGSVVESVRSFVADVRDGMAEREQEIHAALAEGMLVDDTLADLHDEVWADGTDTETPKGKR